MIEAIVSRARGSWKYQDAFGISCYIPKVTKDGRIILRCSSSKGKYSAPQLKRLALNNLPSGSLHNQRLLPGQYVVNDYGDLVLAKFAGQIWNRNNPY